MSLWPSLCQHLSDKGSVKLLFPTLDRCYYSTKPAQFIKVSILQTAVHTFLPAFPSSLEASRLCLRQGKKPLTLPWMQKQNTDFSYIAWCQEESGHKDSLRGLLQWPWLHCPFWVRLWGTVAMRQETSCQVSSCSGWNERPRGSKKPDRRIKIYLSTKYVVLIHGGEQSTRALTQLSYTGSIKIRTRKPGQG